LKAPRPPCAAMGLPSRTTCTYDRTPAVRGGGARCGGCARWSRDHETLGGVAESRESPGHRCRLGFGLPGKKRLGFSPVRPKRVRSPVVGHSTHPDPSLIGRRSVSAPTAALIFIARQTRRWERPCVTKDGLAYDSNFESPSPPSSLPVNRPPSSSDILDGVAPENVTDGLKILVPGPPYRPPS